MIQTRTLIVSQVAIAILLAPAAATAGSLPSYVTEHFLAYKTKISPETDSFEKRGPVRLADQFREADYTVVTPKALLLPANKNDEGVIDPTTHLLEYKIKPTKGTPKFPGLSGVRVVNQCNDLVLTVKQPVSLLVPTAKDPTDPVDPPSPPDPGTHLLDHFLCYKASAQKKLADGTKLPKFPKGIQVRVVDQFEERLYDLKSITKLCNPVDKSGNPVFLSGTEKGNPAPLDPSPIRNPTEHLVCYKAKIAGKEFPQSGCGPTGAPGSKLQPKQEAHAPRARVAVSDQLGTLRLDTIKPIELCIPSDKILSGSTPTPTPTPTATPVPTPSPVFSPTPIPPCGFSAPLCNGGCPLGEVCQGVLEPDFGSLTRCGCVPDANPCWTQSTCGSGACPALSECLPNDVVCSCFERESQQCVDDQCSPQCGLNEVCQPVAVLASNEIVCECGLDLDPCNDLQFPACAAGSCPPQSSCLLSAPAGCFCTR